MPKTKIRIYLKSGQVFEYDVASGSKAREHAYKIWQEGYRSTVGGSLEWYGPHWIDKIKITPAPDSNYVDKEMGT